MISNRRQEVLTITSFTGRVPLCAAFDARAGGQPTKVRAHQELCEAHERDYRQQGAVVPVQGRVRDTLLFILSSLLFFAGVFFCCYLCIRLRAVLLDSPLCVHAGDDPAGARGDVLPQAAWGRAVQHAGAGPVQGVEELWGLSARRPPHARASPLLRWRAEHHWLVEETVRVREYKAPPKPP